MTHEELQVGVAYRVVACTSPKHHFNIGARVEFIRLDAYSPRNAVCQDERELRQYINLRDLEKADYLLSQAFPEEQE